MNIKFFNHLMLTAWLMIVIGVGLVSVPAALVVGGAVLLVVTLTIAFRVGVTGMPRKEGS